MKRSLTVALAAGALAVTAPAAAKQNDDAGPGWLFAEPPAADSRAAAGSALLDLFDRVFEETPVVARSFGPRPNVSIAPLETENDGSGAEAGAVANVVARSLGIAPGPLPDTLDPKPRALIAE